MMKEYLFTVIKPKGEQAGQASPITVSEGISVHVEISAKRVAFALSGLVTFLARVPAQNVIVEAKWISNPTPDLHLTRLPSTENLTCPLNNDGVMTVPLEQAWTNETGHFEIRGLFPGCVYAVAVQTTEESADPSARDPATLFDPEVYRESVVERAIPEVLHVLMAPRDTAGLSFFAIRPFFLQTLTVSVDTADEFFPTLHLTLFPLDRPDRWVVKHDFSVDSILFTLTGPKLASIVG
ncbi:putative carboxypeptidase regulatory region-containing [Fasciolopsis buskii]|uniref:Putative carboxypeptidase regulatory region-containing n=1 Tax=Fasciolopsis buskii TaxID=27845 RepID=A0A8E0S8A4_9TREM|nr:putative carboxypeptidase regulatory region-containing [Fasciolopsis buski]